MMCQGGYHRGEEVAIRSADVESYSARRGTLTTHCGFSFLVKVMYLDVLPLRLPLGAEEPLGRADSTRRAVPGRKKNEKKNVKTVVSALSNNLNLW